jgi:hypothetical protein
MMKQCLGQERIATAVPPHVDDKPGRAAVLDKAEQPITELSECPPDDCGPSCTGNTPLLCGQVFKPVRQVTVAQMQRARLPGHRFGQHGPGRRVPIPSELARFGVQRGRTACAVSQAS